MEVWIMVMKRLLGIYQKLCGFRKPAAFHIAVQRHAGHPGEHTVKVISGVMGRMGRHVKIRLPKKIFFDAGKDPLNAFFGILFHDLLLSGNRIADFWLRVFIILAQFYYLILLLHENVFFQPVKCFRHKAVGKGKVHADMAVSMEGPAVLPDHADFDAGFLQGLNVGIVLCAPVGAV